MSITSTGGLSSAIQQVASRGSKKDRMPNVIGPQFAKHAQSYEGEAMEKETIMARQRDYWNMRSGVGVSPKHAKIKKR